MKIYENQNSECNESLKFEKKLNFDRMKSKCYIFKEIFQQRFWSVYLLQIVWRGEMTQICFGFVGMLQHGVISEEEKGNQAVKKWKEKQEEASFIQEEKNRTKTKTSHEDYTRNLRSWF